MKTLIVLFASLSATFVIDPADLRGQGVLPDAVTERDYDAAGAQPVAKVELGRMLFFDKVLSGNRNISCSTCHHPDHGTADGVALGFGEGATALGPDRRPGASLATSVHGRVPRNAPALFNLGAREFTRMFHDGRVEVDEHGHFASGFATPARFKLPQGLDTVLAAQAMFPVTSPVEMAGQQGENPIADARALNNVSGAGGVWELLAGRLAAIPEYVELFREAYPDEVEQPGDITFVLAANAIAAFEASAFRADRSPFDAFLRGEDSLSQEALAGAGLFYGKANCASCHSGPFQTDHDFHAIAMPQIGPGKADGRDAGYWGATGIHAFVEDHGRGRETVRREDRFKFRTPSLRNVALTGPWGHAGAYTDLEQVVRHHLDPVASLDAYSVPDDLLAPPGRLVEFSATGDSLRQTWVSPDRAEGFARRDDFVQQSSKLRSRIGESNELAPVALEDAEVRALLAFLESLTDPSSQDLGHLVPETVPSGLPVAD